MAHRWQRRCRIIASSDPTEPTHDVGTGSYRSFGPAREQAEEQEQKIVAIPSAQLTHLGIFVHDPEQMAAFYTEMFGMVVVDRGEFRGKDLTFMTGSTDEHHQVVLVKGRTGEPATKVLGQVSFRVDSLADLRSFASRAVDLGATELEARNHGNSWSIYFRDPEYNVIEMYVVTPWQVRQPWRVDLDLDAPDEVISAETLERIERDGVLISAEDWAGDVARRLDALRSSDNGSADRSTGTVGQ
jgi:catechol 2,3-dioxygenase